MRISTPLPCLAVAILIVRSVAAVEIDAPRLFATLDANGDGRVTSAEAGDENGRLFARLVRTSDDDGDGMLSAAEFATGLTPVRAEKELVAKQGSRLPGSDALLVLLARMDVNSDRRLDAAEITEQYRSVFQQMLTQGDADKNGRLDTREIADAAPKLGLTAQIAAARMGINVATELAALPPERRAALERMNSIPNPQEMMADPAQAAEMFARLDADGNQKLSAEEAPPGLASLIKRGDRDGDGQLSAAEFQAMVKRLAAFNAPPADPAAARRNVRQILKRFDRNGDGKLSREEVPSRMAVNFDRLDQDASGALDAQELQRTAAARGGMPAGGAQQQPEMDKEMQ